MKHQNVIFTAIASYSNGTLSNVRAFTTTKAMSNWVNKQFKKDEMCTVTVYKGYTNTITHIYHA